jgi:predicted small metal-binding protein
MIALAVGQGRKGEYDGGANVREAQMSRKTIDCRDFPSESGCTIAISADSADEVVEAAAQHAVQVHGHQDSPELRDQLRQGVKEGAPA